MNEEAADVSFEADDERWVRPMKAHLLEAVKREYEARTSRGGRLSGDDLTAVADTLLKEAVGLGASDIHLAMYSDRFRVRVRVDGALVDVLELPLEAGRHLVRHFKVMADLDPVKTFSPLDARQTRSVDGREIDLRMTCVFEVWRLREEDYRLILNHADEQAIREDAVARGHRPLLTDGLSMAAEGVTSLDELKVLGSFYVPPPQTPAAQAVQDQFAQ